MLTQMFTQSLFAKILLRQRSSSMSSITNLTLLSNSLVLWRNSVFRTENNSVNYFGVLPKRVVPAKALTALLTCERMRLFMDYFYVPCELRLIHEHQSALVAYLRTRFSVDCFYVPCELRLLHKH
mmetsp:Transcript_7929/g.21001  ORF Transcript_7929/g.21001 Transcript_7929/m.21001 type:complete len:125 (-) Transcript_7929:783-1157(-)